MEKKIETLSKKKIYCYNKNYELTEFESARKASNVLKICYKRISASVTGRYITPDYVFSLTPLNNIEIDKKFTAKLLRADVKATDLITGKVTIFKSQIEGAQFFNCNFRNINLVLKGKRRSCANQRWEYLN